jgi:hypothetical protein
MGLMPESRLQGMRDSIHNRARRLFYTNDLDLSSYEFIAAFINPEHINALTQVQDIVGSVGNTWCHTEIYANYGGGLVERVSFNVTFERNPPIILPRYVHTGLQPSAPTDIIEKINVWVLERLRLGKIFGDAVDALSWLNNNCKDIRAMRAMFPALPVLLRDVATDEKSAAARMAIKLDSSKGVTTLPTLPREVRDRILEASNLINTTTLLDGVKTDRQRDAGTSTFSYSNKYKPNSPNMFYPENSGTFL